MEFLSADLLAKLLGVLSTNVVLSGDNAVVIAMAARRLHGPNRRKAIVWGTVGAVVLRLIFAAIVSYLLSIPFLEAVGGLLLLWISWKLVQEDPSEEKVQAGRSPWEAVRIIIAADAVMSLDNVVALVGFGSTLLTSLLDRFPILVYAGAGLLVYIAVEMFFDDEAAGVHLEPYADFEWLIGLGAVALFVAVAWLWAKRTGEAERAEEGSDDNP